MWKNILGVILGFCILALAGIAIYLYIVGAAAERIDVYVEKNLKLNEEDNSGQEEGDQFSGIITASMEGFSFDSQGGLEQKKNAKEDADKKEVPDESYILPDSDSKYYQTKDLKKLTKQEVRLARNEIYARHGRKFTKDLSIKKYFEGKSWYHATQKEVPDSQLNKYEIANRDLIVAYEKKKKWR